MFKYPKAKRGFSFLLSAVLCLSLIQKQPIFAEELGQEGPNVEEVVSDDVEDEVEDEVEEVEDEEVVTQ